MCKTFRICLLFLLCFLVYGMHAELSHPETTVTPDVDNASQVFQSLSPSETRKIIQRNIDNPFFAILDVRPFKNFSDGHIGGAINIDQSLDNFTLILDDLDKTMTYVVYSQNGKSSKSVFLLMKKAGFLEVYHLSGGLTRWQEEGYETKKRTCRCGMQK